MIFVNSLRIDNTDIMCGKCFLVVHGFTNIRVYRAMYVTCVYMYVKALPIKEGLKRKTDQYECK